MSRRTTRSRLIHLLLSPVPTRVVRRAPRVRRSFRPIQPRWSFARRWFVEIMPSQGDEGARTDADPACS